MSTPETTDTGSRVASSGLFGRMLVEEYRLHAELFGRTRFLTLPIFIAVVVAGGVWFLELTGSSLGAIIAGLHALVFFLGLQVGTIGLVGRDAMRDVLGDTTLLVFSARTLPISRRRLLGVFILSDIVYYLGFFLTPVVVGFLPVALAGGLSLPTVGLFWLTLSGTFALGTGASLALAGIGTRSKLALLLVGAAIAGAVILEPSAVIGLTPYAVSAEPTVTTAAKSAVVLAAVLVAGPFLFEPATGRSLRRSNPGRFRQLTSLGGVHTARSLLEVNRSSGSVWKVAFSLGVLFGVTALLLDRVATATGIEPSGGIAFGALLGLGTFTTYNWVTQADDGQEYLRYPDGLVAVFRGKLRAFLLLSLPAGFGYLALSALWYPLTDLVVGVVVFPLVSLYVFGLTAFLTGFRPNELLFDTPLFALYGAGLALLSVPLLVAALTYTQSPRIAVGVSICLAFVAGGVGIALVRQTPGRCQKQLRS